MREKHNHTYIPEIAIIKTKHSILFNKTFEYLNFKNLQCLETINTVFEILKTKEIQIDYNRLKNE